jgi:hypothetical protein
VKEAETDRPDGAVGDRYRPAAPSENDRGKLVKHYAEQAKKEEGATVGLLAHALEIVVSDLGDESLANLIDVAWIPASRLDEVDPPWGGPEPLRGRGELGGDCLPARAPVVGDRSGGLLRRSLSGTVAISPSAVNSGRSD